MANERSRAVLIVIVVLVVSAIAGAATLSIVRSTPDLDPTTPEGVAQAYFEAVIAGEDLRSLEMLTPELRDRCDVRNSRFFRESASVRVVLVSTEIVGDRAEVNVEVDQVANPSPFDLDGFSSRQRLVMTRIAGGWEISEAPWPYFCPEGS